MGGRRSPPPPRTLRSRQGSRTPCQRLAPSPRLVQHPSPPPCPTGRRGFLPSHGAQRRRGSAWCGSRTCPCHGRVAGAVPGARPGAHTWWSPSPRPCAGGRLLPAAAAGCAVSQLSAQWGPSRPRDPPCPPLCFADPAACSCRLPRLVARFQPHSAYLSSSLHPTARVYPPRPALPLPAPQPPARQGLSSAEEGRHGTFLASSRHALASLSQAAARAPCMPGKVCPLHPSLPLPWHFTEDGALIRPPRPPWPHPAARAGSRSPLSPASLPPFLPGHSTTLPRAGSAPRALVAVQTAEPVPASPTGDHSHWGQSCGDGEGGPEPPRPGTGHCSPAAPQPATIRPAAANKAL